MRVELERINDAVNFKATDEDGLSISIDGSKEIGGQGLGLRPMALVLSALASCSSIDVVTILKKQRQELLSMRVLVDGERATQKVPQVFERIHLHFILQGNLVKERVEKAIDLSINTYCSVAAMLRQSATISYSFLIED